MQIKCPHRKFYRLDAIRDELSQGFPTLVAIL